MTVGYVLVFAMFSGFASAQKQLDKQIEAIIASVARPGEPGLAVMVRQGDRTVFQRAIGVSDLRSKTPLSSQTDFRLASCTKQFTAMAIMLLVHDGKLQYETRLTDVFPDFPDYGKKITVRHLLNHTSGLPDYESLMPEGKWMPEHQISDAEVLALLKSQSAGRFEPGTKWSYSNSGYVVLGQIVAKIAGKSFPHFLKERIFDPLKMRNTLAFVAGEVTIPNRVYGHSKEGAGFVQTDQSSTSATLGDGGVYSNLDDLARWDAALAAHTLLSERDMAAALTPVKLADGSQPTWDSGPGDTDPLAGRLVSYGFGWFLDPYRGQERMWHYGDTMGFKAAIMRYPKERLSIVVLANYGDADAIALAEKISDVYLNRSAR